jgi:glutathione S-transferase
MRLFDWGPSPFCMKVRSILDHKQIEYERVMVLGPPLLELLRRGRIGKVPALDIDGRLICDSTDIAHELERLHPAPAILPADPRQRGLCHAIEEWADESLYFVNLYFQWIDPEGAPLVAPVFRKIPVVGHVTYPLFLRRVRAQVQGQGTGRKPPEQLARDLERHLDAIDDMLAGRAFLLDGGPFLCDFALNAQLVYLSRTPVGGRALRDRTSVARYMENMRSLRDAHRTRADDR